MSITSDKQSLRKYCIDDLMRQYNRCGDKRRRDLFRSAIALLASRLTRQELIDWKSKLQLRNRNK